jgi:CHAD domain-containing protein
MPPSGSQARSAKEGPTIQREVEWTLDAPGTWTPAVAAEVADGIDLVLGDAVEHVLEATYFDTAGLALAQRGCTLRRREGGSDAGWHLKVPSRGGRAQAGALARDEVMLPLPAATDGPPSELTRLVRAWTLDEPLIAVAVLTTRRRVHPLRDRDGGAVGELAVDDVSARLVGAEGDDAPSPASASFSQWDVEAVGEGADACAALVHALVARGATPASTESKLRRALAGTGRILAPAGRPRTGAADPSAGEVFVAHVAALTDELTAEDHRVRLGQDDSVHRMRVASRRIRSALRTFAPILRTEELGEVRSGLRTVADTLGAERDLEVAQQRLVRLTADAEGWAGGDASTAKFVRGMLVPLLAREQALARAASLEAMDRPEWTALPRDLHRLIDDPPLRRRSERPATQAIPRLVGTQWDAVRTRAEAIGPSSDDEQWHRLRLAAKQARYSADAAVAPIGSDAARLARRLRDLTELLGELQDTVLLRTTLDRLMAQGTPVLHALDEIDGRALYALGRLRAAEERRAEALKAAFPGLWERAADRRSRRWLKI